MVELVVGYEEFLDYCEKGPDNRNWSGIFQKELLKSWHSQMS